MRLDQPMSYDIIKNTLTDTSLQFDNLNTIKYVFPPFLLSFLFMKKVIQK